MMVRQGNLSNGEVPVSGGPTGEPVIELCSQYSQVPWERMNRLAKTYLPNPEIQHPYPEQHLPVTT
jgi:hypothetical protein